MEETLCEAPPADDWRAGFAQTIDEQRRRVGERIATQRERLRELEARIAAQLDEVTHSLNQQQGQAQKAAAEAETQEGNLTRRAAELEQMKAELDGLRQQLTAQQAEISRRQAELEQLQAGLAGQNVANRDQADALTRQQAELAAARQACEAEAQKLETEREEVRKTESALKLQLQALGQREHQMAVQRRHIAQQLRARKKELASEIELHRAAAQASAAGQDVQGQMRLAELQGRYDHLREEFDKRQEQHDQSTQRLAELQARLESREQELQQRTAAQAELERVRRESQQQIDQLRARGDKSGDEQVQALRAELDELRTRDAQMDRQRKQLEAELAALKSQPSNSSGAAADLAKLREENKQLEAWLAEAEEKNKRGGSGGGGQDMDDLRRRFEMAVQDVRELKTKNAELTDELAKARQSSGSAQTGPGQDWEALKQRMLAQMENDFDESDEQEKADKLTVQGAIKITDEIVAEKERELSELKRLLDSQAQQVGGVAVGAQAVAQMLDSDELIRQERENLQRLQDGLREQLKAAEIDISLERAKLAREKAELEEKMRNWEAERPAQTASAENGPGDKGKKPAGRKWLTRLGLSETKAE